MMSAYRELKSKDRDTTELDAHLENCAACRAVLASYTRIGDQLRTTPVCLPEPDMQTRLMKTLADEQLKFLKKSAPGKASTPTPEFLKPYLQERAEEAQNHDEIAAFSTAETGPLPIIHARRKPRQVRVKQFAVLGMAAAVLIMLMMGGLTSLLMLARSNPTSINRTTISLTQPTEVDEKDYAMPYPNVASVIPSGNDLYYTTSESGPIGDNWMVVQFDRNTHLTNPLLNTSSSNPLIMLQASNNWLVWLEYDFPQSTTHGKWSTDSHDLLPRAWSVHYLSLLSQASGVSNGISTKTESSTPTSTGTLTGKNGTQSKTQNGTKNGTSTTATLPASTILMQDTFYSETVPNWVSTPVQGTWLIGDTLLITSINQNGVSQLQKYQLGQTGSAGKSMLIASAPAGHVFAWPTADDTGMNIYWSDEWITGDGTLHSNIWQQQTIEQLISSRKYPEVAVSYVKTVLMGDGLSFQPQVVDDTLFFLSTSEMSVSNEGVTPNGTPFPVNATDMSVIATPRTNLNVYKALPDASIHGTIVMLPLNGLNEGIENTLGTVGQETGLQAGNSYIVWQDSSGYKMYDVANQVDVSLGDTLNNASLLVVGANTTLWLASNETASSNLTMMTYNWPN